MIKKMMRKAFRMTALTFLIFELNIVYGFTLSLSILGAIHLNLSMPMQISISIILLGCFALACKYTHRKFEDAWLHRTLEQVYEGRKLERKTILNSQGNKKEKKNISNRLHENGLTFEQYIHALEQKVESLEAMLVEANEIIDKNNWKKWFIPACSAMGDTIRENTNHRKDLVTIKRKDFYARIISHYPDFKNLKGKPFGTAMDEAWKRIPVAVKLDD
ncbi:hypothetical protein SAMN05660337_2517 [Maridesulfovibrio ferrireducens]|uniref:Uncharacterized protein n=1 Tax=Maridesulfovibrio ferrireducens TaxID=246191 RepID=A0A1G9IBE8_9BACT|nr:hypothetical protein [Maridesulfovibrio ferrireducens]SDL22442.1 hypothetical protein SAMN05660337_2517 [Maridesulfovibrio ferrireducens]